MTQRAWVLGASGLLGSALVRALRQEGILPHRPAAPFAWRDAVAVRAQLGAEVDAFAQGLAGASHWTLYWAAGVGSMGASAAELEPETHCLATLLDCLRQHPRLQQCPGSVVFASSAGALYGAARAVSYNELSEVTPTTAYAESKLRQEALVRAFADGAPNAGALVLRYSTLYGIGQSRSKAQGLITQIARRLVANEPSHIFVPLDTIRDYLHADDAARMTLATLRDVQADGGKTTVKIIAAERPTSIAQLIGVFRRLAGRSPRLVTSASSLSAKYVRSVQFVSIEPAGKPHPPGRTLIEGIHQVLEAERANRARPS